MSAPKIHLSFAAYPGYRHEESAQRAHQEKSSGALMEPALGEISLDHIQIVPQNRGVFDIEAAHALREQYPNSQFRLHANVHVMPRRMIYDISNFEQNKAWFEYAAKVSQALGAAAYSAHAGYKKEATLDEVFANTLRIQDLFGHKVAVEGLYRDKEDTQQLSTWADYARLLEAGVYYALDLSHLNIVAFTERKREHTLVQELLASPFCIEVHVSDNNGRGDQHAPCNRAPWWTVHLEHVNPDAIFFSEGNRRLEEAKALREQRRQQECMRKAGYAD